MHIRKVLFCSRYYIGDSKDHLSKKFSNQIKAMKKIGYDPYYLAIADKSICLYHDNRKLKVLERIRFSSIPHLSNILLYRKLYKCLSLALELVPDCEILYCRMMFALHEAVYALKKAKEKNIKVIMEIPSYPSNDEHIRLKGLKKIAINYYDKKAAKMGEFVDLYALIGEFADSLYGKPAINISNGINVEELPLKKIKSKRNNEVNILVLAAMAYWHGYDRLLGGLSEYLSKINCESIKPILHFVGPDADGSIHQWGKYVRDNNIQDYVVFHGPLYEKKLDEIFDLCDIACASLGMHRKNKTVTSELKIREYMSRGIPFIYSSVDPALDENLDYTLKVSPDESNINFRKVVEFANKNANSLDISENMREYAMNNMTWEANFTKLLDKLDEV